MDNILLQFLPIFNCSLQVLKTLIPVGINFVNEIYIVNWLFLSKLLAIDIQL